MLVTFSLGTDTIAHLKVVNDTVVYSKQKKVLVTFSSWTCTIALLTVINGTVVLYPKERACHFQPG